MKVTEITIILVIILLIFGVILNSIENSTEKIITSQEKNNMEKLVSEAADNLINNPGIPENWNEYGSGTPGLAIVNEGGQTVPNSISYAKLIALSNNYDKLVYQRLFDSKIKTSMELIPQKSSISSVKIGDVNEGTDIFSITRYVKCDFYKNYVLKDFGVNGKCNKHHDQEKNSCNYFKVFPGNLKSADYYLLVRDGSYETKYIVDTTRVVKDKEWQTAVSDEIYLNDKIEFYDDNSAIVFVHINKPDAEAVLVSVPKNFDESLLKYDYFRTNDCQFIIKAWL